MKPFKMAWLKLFQLCTLLIIATIATAQQPVANFSADLRSGCPPMVVNFKDLSTGNPTSWKWNLGNGTISLLQNPTATYFNPGSYTVTLIVKNANGEDTITRTQYIVVNALPQVNFGASDTTGCFPLPVRFTDSSAGAAGSVASWRWDFGDGNLSSLQNPSHTYSGPGNFTVTLQITNTNGCVKAFTRPSYVRIQTGVKADFSFVSAAGCHAPSSVAFSNLSAGTGVINSQWFFGDNTTSVLNNPTHLYQSAGSYTVKLVVTNSTGCTDTLVKTNALNIGFVKANFTRPDTICADQTFAIINTSSPATVGATWSFGDGTTSNQINPSKSYSISGTYQIKLVNDFGGCSDSITKSIYILSKPLPSFAASNTSGCSFPMTVNFTNTTAGVGSYTWDFGDGSTSTQANPVHTYNRAGTFTVTLAVTNASNCSEATVKFDFIKITPPQIQQLGSFPVKGCLPLPLVLNPVIQSNEPISTYFWDFGDGNTSTLQAPNYIYTTPGSYTVSLKITTVSGCVDSLSLKDGVNVGRKPMTAFSANPRDVCAQVNLPFIDESTGPPVHTWYWTFGDGTTSIVKNPIHPYSDTGNFTVQLIVSNFGCTDTLRKVDYIHVSPPVSRFDTAYFCNDRMTRRFIDKSLGANTWAWSFGDGATSTLANPSHTYALPGYYFVTLKVTNATCEHSSTQTIRIINESGLLSSDSIACRNTLMTFDIKNINPSNISSYKWYFDGFSKPFNLTSTIPVSTNYTTTGTKAVAVITTDMLGCTDTLYRTVPVSIYGPTAGFSASPAGTCFNNLVTFSDTSVSDGIHPLQQWIWNYGDTIETSIAPPFVHTYVTPGTYTVGLTVVDSRGCRDSVSKLNMIMITSPTASFTIKDSVLCPATALTINNLSTGLNLNHVWDFGDGTTSNALVPVHSYSTEGSFVISLSITDKFGCTNAISKTVRVFKADAGFTMSDSFSSCPPLLVNFTTKTNSFINHGYDFGDGGISTLLNPSHLYTYPGTYYVKRWSINNGGCTDTVVQKIIIQGPIGTLSYNPLNVCNPATVDFVATTKNCVSYVWDYNDGTTVYSTNTATKHIYSSPGIYLPKIILEDASGCKVPVTGLDTIKVNGIETYIKDSKRMLCDSGYVTFSDSSMSNDVITSYLWDFGDGVTSTQQNPVHFYSTPGLYDVTLKTTTLSGCIATAAKQNHIKVKNSPDIAILGSTSACAPAAFPFHGTLLTADTSVLSWNWSFGNGQVSGQQNPVSQYFNLAGAYTVKVIATNMDGCSDTSTLPITVHPKPLVYAGADTFVCRGQSFLLAATGAATYAWVNEPTLSCINCADPLANPTTSVQYKVTGTTLFGCSNTDSVTLQVQQPFKMSVAQGDTLCIGESLTLKASGAGSYQWTPSQYLSDGTSPTPVATPKITTRYQVTGKDARNCFSDTGYITLTVFSMPMVTIKGDSIQNLAAGNALQLETTSSSDITKWKWSPSSGLNCNTCPSPITSATQNTTYTVVASNDGNCISRDQVTVLVLCDNANIYIPNTFSPNGDGTNDVFFPRGKGVYTIKAFRIFNRWGQIVFEKGAINANDASQGWDGAYNGVKLNPDVFLYIADVVCQNGFVFPIKGNVTLIR